MRCMANAGSRSEIECDRGERECMAVCLFVFRVLYIGWMCCSEYENAFAVVR